MKIKPLPDRVNQAAAYLTVALSSPVWAPVIGGILVIYCAAKMKRKVFGPCREWQTWFAWYPVHLDAPWGDWVWLEHVQRRSFDALDGCDYKAVR